MADKSETALNEAIAGRLSCELKALMTCNAENDIQKIFYDQILCVLNLAYKDRSEFEAGRIAEREHCSNVIKTFWRTFFVRDWTLDDIDALLLRVKEGDRP